MLLEGSRAVDCHGSKKGSRACRLTALTIATLAAVLVAQPAEAKKNGASNPGWDFFGYSAYDYSPRYYKPKPRTAKRPATPKDGEAAVAEKVAPYKGDGKPMFLMVSLRKQRISVFDSTGRVAEAPISSGRIGFSTPTGVFSVLEKKRTHFSNLYEDAPMPNMQRLTWSGVALHAGALPGYPASHGCVRLPHNFSRQLFDMTKLGTRVVVTRDPVEPVAFSHEKLFRSYPPDDAPLAQQPQASIEEPVATVQTASAEGTNPSAITQVLGITTADAATLPPAASPLRAKRKAERAEVEAAIDAVKANKTKLEDAAKAAVADADAAKLGLRGAREEVGSLQKALRQAEAEREKGDRTLAAYYRKYAGTSPLTDEQRAAAVEEEKTLEANALVLEDAVDAAKAAVEGAQRSVTEAEGVVASIDQKRRDAIRALSDASDALRATASKLSALNSAEALRNYPASVYISRKNGKLYVRQKHKPVFEAAVTFANPDQPLGTQIYTALDYANEGKTQLAWNAISIPGGPPKADNRSRLEKLKAKVQAREAAVPEPVPATRQTPESALERVQIDDATRERLEDIMKPGSSVIISDHGLGNETGEFTDFIVLTSQ